MEGHRMARFILCLVFLICELCKADEGVDINTVGDMESDNKVDNMKNYPMDNTKSDNKVNNLKSDDNKVDNVKSTLEDLLQKLNSIQQTMEDQEEKIFDKLNKRIESFEVNFMGKVEKFIEEMLPNRTEIETDIEKILETENKTTPYVNCSGEIEQLTAKITENDNKITELKDQVEFLNDLWNRSDCVQNCKMCTDLSPCKSMTSSTPTVHPSMTLNTKSDQTLVPSLSSTSFTSFTSVSVVSTPSLTSASEFSPLSVTSSSLTSASSNMYTTSSVVTTSPSPPEHVNFLVVPIWSSSYLPFRYIDFKHKEDYFDVHYNQIDTVACAPNLNKIIISTYSPDRIIQFDSNGLYTKVIKSYMKSFGMTVDNVRNYVFLTTMYPSKAVLRMAVDGTDVEKVMDLSHLERHPRAIAVNPLKKVIYASDDSQIFSLNYDGTDFTTLAYGLPIYGLTVDDENNVVYYSVGQGIFRINPADKWNNDVLDGTEIIRLKFFVHNLKYHAKKLYFSGYDDSTVGVIDVSNPDEASILDMRSMYLPGCVNFSICPY